MKFSEGLIQAYKRKWAHINNFSVQFMFNERIKSGAGTNDDGISWDEARDGYNINLNVISIDTPQFTNQPIEVFVANMWKIHNGRDELYRFSMTFRDEEDMKYYKKFLRLYQITKEDYFDNIKFNVILNKDPDYYGDVITKIFELNECIVESVSQIQFNTTTENQIAEFTVQFKCIKPELQ